jgi:cobalt transporter subunit CbtB
VKPTPSVSQILGRHDAPPGSGTHDPEGGFVSTIPNTESVSTPLVLPLSKSVIWLVGAALLALALYYFIGIDQGAVSVFGSDTHVHELVHDGRHLIGFPCH